MTDGFEVEVEVGLLQGAALSNSVVAMVMDRLTGEVRQDSLRTIMFADEIVVGSEVGETWIRGNMR